jgi:hypothetical protein
MTEYGSEWAAIDAAVDDIRRCRGGGWWGLTNPLNPCTHTNPASGYEAAINILENANTPDDVGQAIVLMSDGLPTVWPDNICTDPIMGWFDDGYYLFPLDVRCAAAGNNPNLGDMEDWAYMAQATATDLDIDVYSTYYGTDNAGDIWLEEHIPANDGSHHVALTKAQIKEAFKDICVEFTGGSAGMLF